MGHQAAVVGELVFSDVETRNSFRVTTAADLSKHLKVLEKTCGVLLFRAEGRVFCSGGNLNDHVSQGPLKGKAANREITKVLSQLNELKIPTVAFVEGDALGGGLELLSAFDFVWSTPHVLFGFWQRRMGLAFGWGGGARLVRRLGAGLVARYALEARALTAHEALRTGLIDRVVSRSCSDSKELREDLRLELMRLALLPKSSVQALKAPRKVPAAEARAEQKVFEKLWFGPTHRAALQSFRNRVRTRALE